MSRRILFAAATHWLSPLQVGDHHLARCFVDDGWQVGFLSAPLSPLHLFGKERVDYRQRIPLWQGGGRYFEHEQLWTFAPAALAVPHPRRPFDGSWLLRNWFRFTVPRLTSRLRATGFDRVDVLHLRDVRFGFLLDVVEADRSVFRLADNDRGFSQFSTARNVELQRVARRITHLYYTARSLEPLVKELSPRATTHLPNGVWANRFSHAASPPRPADLSDIPDPIALYVGSIDEWFDFALLRFAAHQLPTVSFVVIGPPRLAVERLSGLPNVYVLGRRPHESIPAYLHHAAVGLIPFDVSRHATLVNAINPIKLYEYLAAGLPTVAVSWDELQRIRSPATLTHTEEEFVAAIAGALQHPPAREPLQAFAREHDWSCVYSRLLGFLGV